MLRQQFPSPVLLARGVRYAYQFHPDGTRLYRVIEAGKLSRRSRRRWRRRGVCLGLARDVAGSIVTGART